MKAVVMAGGEGSRLRPLTVQRPKPMVPVANKPILAHIVELLRRHQFTDIRATLHYLGDDIRSHFADGAEFGVRISYSVEESPMGTAGSVKLCEEFVGQEPFLVISGDALTDIDLAAATAFHKQRGALATLVLTRVENPLEYGIVVTDDEGRIQRFLEKPSWGEVFSDTVNSGIYILEPEVLRYIEPGRAVDFSQDVFPVLLKKKAPLFGFVSSGYWCDVGNIGAYRMAHDHVLEGLVQVDVDGRRINDVWMGRDVVIDATAEIRGPAIIGDNCRIGPGARILGYTVLGSNCIVEEQATIQRSIVWHGVFVGRGAHVSGAILGQQVAVDRGCVIGEGAVVGDRSVLRQGAKVAPQVKVWPNKVVEAGARVNMSVIWGSAWHESLFRDRGVSGLTNVEMTPEFAVRLAAAFGTYLGKGTVVTTSRDEHPASRMILRSLIVGFLTVGTSVQDLRSTPLTIARRAVPVLGAAGGVHVRVDPRDPSSTLVELLDHRGINVHRSAERKIESLFFREEFRRTPAEEVGRLDFPARVLESYTEAFFDFIDAPRIARRRFKIVVDYAYGRLSMVVPGLLARLGCEVIALHPYPDPRRAPRSREDRARMLVELGQAVAMLGADLGALIDDDGERLFLVDEQGRTVSEEILLALMTRIALEGRPSGSTVGVPVSAPSIVDQIAAERGAQVLRTKHEARALMHLAAAHRDNMVIAGNTQGGFIFPAFHPTQDALVALARVLMALADGGRLSELVAQVPDFYLQEQAIECPWEYKGRVMRLLAREAGTAREAEYIDGIKMFYDRGWVLALPDASEPVFHLIAEGKSRSDVEELIGRYATRIQELQKKGA
ncbi:mannose-1-phosphate guanyltransferase [Carboxydochorda subterranea]|uniref:Mannose-1-phosphate guanyltransferase n=1 Tax=Carboxydichorda subterranea TaxID=3109565 RepID=A0ABZ1BUQ8_9FIRM|nr:mannose-1-phosphate guanyltransferase [Limnochorda sp. L945t]WRP16388.1 mannose-1-phosphate guanyltransferase [Limnochorda sp. L945t]